MKKSVMLVFSFLLLFQLAFTVVPQLSYACSCLAPEPPKESLEKSVAVFSGKVKKVEEIPSYYKVTLDVDKTWKGVDQQEVSVVTAIGGSAACGFNFEQGEEYLIYAHKTNEGDLSVSLCSRTTQLQSATEDLNALGSGKVPGNDGAEPPQEAEEPAVPNEETMGLAPIVWGIIGVLFLAAVAVGLLRSKRK